MHKSFGFEMKTRMIGEEDWWEKTAEKEVKFAGKTTRQRETSKPQLKHGLKIASLQADTMLRVNIEKEIEAINCVFQLHSIGWLYRIDEINTLTKFPNYYNYMIWLDTSLYNESEY